MRQARTLEEVERIRASIARIGKLSDSVIRIGPFGLGLDGLLAWVPLVPAGAIYSAGAGAFLLMQGWRARVPAATLGLAAVLLTARTAASAIGEEALPLILVELGVDLFRAHKWTADMLLKAIDEADYVQAGLGAVDTYRSHRTMAASVTMAR